MQRALLDLADQNMPASKSKSSRLSSENIMNFPLVFELVHLGYQGARAWLSAKHRNLFRHLSRCSLRRGLIYPTPLATLKSIKGDSALKFELAGLSGA